VYSNALIINYFRRPNVAGWHDETVGVRFSSRLLIAKPKWWDELSACCTAVTGEHSRITTDCTPIRSWTQMRKVTADRRLNETEFKLARKKIKENVQSVQGGSKMTNRTKCAIWRLPR